MADNTTLNSGSGGDVIRTDDIGGVKFPVSKIALGADGTDGGFVSSANPLPVNDAGGTLSVDDGGSSLTVDGPLTDAQLRATAVPVSAASLPLPTGAAAESGGNLAAAAASLALLDNIVAGNEAQVDVLTLPALPAGSNNIGDVDVASIAAGDNNIGNVDIVTMPNVTLNALPAGSNNIGDVDILSIAAGDNNIGNVDVVTLPATPAGTNLIGSVAAQLDVSTLRDGAGTALTPKFVVIDAATSGDNTLLAAVTSKKIRVLSLFMVAAAAVVARFESGAGGTALTGQMNLAANGGFVLPFNPIGWFETASNTLLNLELGGAVSVDGCLCYVEV